MPLARISESRAFRRIERFFFAAGDTGVFPPLLRRRFVAKIEKVNLRLHNNALPRGTSGRGRGVVASTAPEDCPWAAEAACLAAEAISRRTP